MFCVLLSCLLILSSSSTFGYAKSIPYGYGYQEVVANYSVTSVSTDAYGSQHVSISPTALNSTASPNSTSLFLFQKNTAYNSYSNPNNYTIVPYFSYGVNVTKLYLIDSMVPEITSYGHYLPNNHTGDVALYNGKNVTIDLSSTQKELALIEDVQFAKFVANQLCAAASHNLPNNVVFLNFGDINFKFMFTKTKLKTFSSLQIDIIENVLKYFFQIHEYFASVPGVYLHNFDGYGNDAYFTFANEESDFKNTLLVDEETYARIAMV